MFVDTTGRVGIANNGPARTLDVNGDIDANNIYASGNVQAAAFLYSSDIRLKKDVSELDNSLEKVNQLNGVSFSWRENDEKGIGLIAQDVERVYPELVSVDDVTGMKSVEYGNLVAPLIEAVKEQQKLIEGQQKEIDDLKDEVEKLKSN